MSEACHICDLPTTEQLGEYRNCQTLFEHFQDKRCGVRLAARGSITPLVLHFLHVLWLSPECSASALMIAGVAPGALQWGTSYPGITAARGYRQIGGQLTITADDPAELAAEMQLNR